MAYREATFGLDAFRTSGRCSREVDLFPGLAVDDDPRRYKCPRCVHVFCIPYTGSHQCLCGIDWSFWHSACGVPFAIHLSKEER